jgi:hypothetical protein
MLHGLAAFAQGCKYNSIKIQAAAAVCGGCKIKSNQLDA